MQLFHAPPGMLSKSKPPAPIYFVPQSYPTLPVQKPPGMLSKTKHPTPIFFLI